MGNYTGVYICLFFALFSLYCLTTTTAILLARCRRSTKHEHPIPSYLVIFSREVLFLSFRISPAARLPLMIRDTFSFCIEYAVFVVVFSLACFPCSVAYFPFSFSVVRGVWVA